MIALDRWSPVGDLTLEPNALDATTEIARNLVLTAGPGAGKTEMLAQRADFLLRTGTCRYPRRILAISFKTDASQNLKARVRKRCGPRLAARFDSHTFHAFAKRIIDRFRPVLSGRDALNPDYSIGQRRVQHQSITFSDLVPLACKIIENSLAARNAVRQTYTHVFLDEFQDCTDEQYRLILACFGDTPTILTAVGDSKQSIMGWAGALEGIFHTFADAFDAVPLNLYQNFRSAPALRRMQNAMVKEMDPAAALEDDDIIGDEGEICILRFEDDDDEASGLAGRIRSLIDDGIEPSEIAILVSKQQNLYCQRLVAAFEAKEVPYREEEIKQDLASEPAACLLIDFLLIASGSRQPAAYRRMLDLVVFNHGYDDEREYQVRSRWDRFINETKQKVAAHEVDLHQFDDLHALAISLIDNVGRDSLIALSPDYERGDRFDELIAQTLEHAHMLLQDQSDASTALASFSGDRAVRIMSVHKSKGLEFDTVVILGVEKETFWGEPSAERAAYFVAISRAKQRLLLTTCDQRQRPQGAKRWFTDRHEYDDFLAYVP
ncbi:ATP-dependent helicase [Thalassovita sp.]|uniref:ATP-dependent helicase n=1 Tax=Thalassovita sp. TaxID=1979401 RepID=UPI002AB0631D|nr:ATP-dependent helicase [Thalassovita sp.]